MRRRRGEEWGGTGRAMRWPRAVAEAASSSRRVSTSASSPCTSRSSVRTQPSAAAIATNNTQQSEVIRATLLEDSPCLVHGMWSIGRFVSERQAGRGKQSAPCKRSGRQRQQKLLTHPRGVRPDARSAERAPHSAARRARRRPPRRRPRRFGARPARRVRRGRGAPGRRAGPRGSRRGPAARRATPARPQHRRRPPPASRRLQSSCDGNGFVSDTAGRESRQCGGNAATGRDRKRLHTHAQPVPCPADPRMFSVSTAAPASASSSCDRNSVSSATRQKNTARSAPRSDRQRKHNAVAHTHLRLGPPARPIGPAASAAAA